MSFTGYQKDLYCDVCYSNVERYQEYFYYEPRDIIMCSSDCLEKYAIEFFEEEVMCCDNE